MQKTKAKRGSYRNFHLLPYAVLWAVTMSISSVIFRAFHTIDTSAFLTPQQALIIMKLSGAFLVAFAQAKLTERLLKRSMRGWVIFSMIGNLIVLFVVLNSSLWNPYIRESVTLRSLLLMLSVPIVQMLWLWPRVHKAWLWPAAQFFALIASDVVIRRFHLEMSFAPWLITRLFGVMCGVLMITLWSHPREAEKAKTDHTADKQSNADHERLSRLQEHDRRTPLWDIGDEQALQSEA